MTAPATSGPVATVEQLRPLLREVYGVRLDWVGENGEVLILGHHGPRRAVAAVTWLHRDVSPDQPGATYRSVAAGLRESWAVLRTACSRVEERDHRHPCPECLDMQGGRWWIAWHRREGLPGVFPVTLWSP